MYPSDFRMFLKIHDYFRGFIEFVLQVWASSPLILLSSSSFICSNLCSIYWEDRPSFLASLSISSTWSSESSLMLLMSVSSPKPMMSELSFGGQYSPWLRFLAVPPYFSSSWLGWHICRSMGFTFAVVKLTFYCVFSSMKYLTAFQRTDMVVGALTSMTARDLPRLMQVMNCKMA